jgi:hypothetical protein
MIDEEVKKIFDEASAKCEQILTEHADQLRAIAGYLLEHETMEAEEFNYFFEHGEFMPLAPQDLRKVKEDKTIERPARKISMSDEAPVAPLPEQSAEPAAQTEPPAEAPAEEPAKAEGEPLVAEGEPLVAAGEPLVAEGETGKDVKAANVLEDVENAPVSSYADVSEYVDDNTFFDQVIGDVRVIFRQIYQQNCEYLMAVGLDAAGNEVWKKETTTDSITELMQTDVFIGGTADAPLVMMYNASKGLTAVDPATGEVKWEIFKKDLNLGGSISHVLDGNGVTYIGGYYGPDPVAIDPQGNVLWKASSGSAEATWLYRMELSDEGIACAYGKMAGEDYGTIIYDFNGNVVSIVKE